MTTALRPQPYVVGSARFRTKGDLWALSKKWLRQLYQDTTLGERALRVALALHHFALCSGSEGRWLASGKWCAWPGTAKLADETGISDRRGVRRALRELEQTRLVVTKQRRGMPSEYRLSIGGVKNARGVGSKTPPNASPTENNTAPRPDAGRAGRGGDVYIATLERIRGVVERCDARKCSDEAMWREIQTIYRSASDEAYRALQRVGFTPGEIKRGLQGE